MASRPPTAQRRDSATVHPFPTPSMVAIVLGAQWGDEVGENYYHIKFIYERFFLRVKANSLIY